MSAIDIDVGQLAADLTNYLHDRGAWDVGAGGQETVGDIAEFIDEWLAGGRQRGEQTAAAAIDTLGATLATLTGDDAHPFCMPEFRRQNTKR